MRSAKGGFSLLELIVVLAIMGFLVAMIAPRLAGVVGGAQRSADDTNISRLLQATSQFQERTGRLPAEMTNLVAETGPDEFVAPNVSNNDPGDGKEALSADLAAVLPLHIHILSDAEAAELLRLGISEVRNFNPSEALDPLFNGIPAIAPSLERVPVVGGETAVLMIGAGHGVGGWSDSLGADDTILDPDFAYRIVLGYGQDSELVTAGQLQGAAISPQGGNTENYLFNNYLLVLPRLAATAQRNLPVPEVTAGSAGRVETFLLDEAQPVFDITVLSPEGRIFPPTQYWTIQ